MSKVLTEEEVLSLLAKVASLHPWRHEVNFLRGYIITLQSERDALRRALEELVAMEHVPTWIGEQIELMLSTPASGEPVRKP